MRPLLAALVLAIGFAPALPGSAQEPPQAPQGPRLQLTFQGDGRVTLISNGATLAEILREWTAKGGTPFVGAERLSTGPLTLQYDKQTETDVLRSLLRQASGLILAPRREGSVGASQFESVYVVATSTATASTSYGSTFTPTYTQPTVSTTGNPSTEVPPVGAAGAGNPAGAAGSNAGTGPGPQPPQQNAPPDYPSAQPTGVRPVASSIVPVPSTNSSTPPPPTPPPANTPPPGTTGRGGGGGGGGIR